MHIDLQTLLLCIVGATFAIAAGVALLYYCIINPIQQVMRFFVKLFWDDFMWR